MKKLATIIILLAFTLNLLFSCHSRPDINRNKADSTDSTIQNKDFKPGIVFLKKNFNFGQIYSGEEPVFYFKFVNTGNGKLYINRVETDCGCTVAQYPEQGVNPGDTGTITVTFNSSGYFGYQIKNILVYTNAQDSAIKLRIEGQVQ